MVRVTGYRSRGPGSISGATRFSEKQWVWNEVHSASWVQLRSYLKEKVLLRSRNLRIRPWGSSRWHCDTLYPQTLALNLPTIGGRPVGKFTRGLGPRSLFVLIYQVATFSAFREMPGHSLKGRQILAHNSYWLSTRGGPATWGLDVGLTIL
jgi:hypothetical protein